MFVVGGFEQLRGARFSDQRRGGEDFWWRSGFGQASGDFGLDGVDQHASADCRTGGDGGSKALDPHHRVPDRRSGIQHEVGEILQFFARGMLGGAGVRMRLADQGHHTDAPLFEFCRHLDGNEVATAGGSDQGAVSRGEIEIAENALGEAGDILEEHGLALAIGADHQIMEGERKFHDGIEPGKGTIAGPHFLDENARMAAAEEMHHAPGKNGF